MLQHKQAMELERERAKEHDFEIEKLRSEARLREEELR